MVCCVLITCQQQVVRVSLVKFSKRHDKLAALPRHTASHKCYKDVPDKLKTCYEEVTRKLLPWHLGLTHLRVFPVESNDSTVTITSLSLQQLHTYRYSHASVYLSADWLNELRFNVPLGTKVGWLGFNSAFNTIQVISRL